MTSGALLAGLIVAHAAFPVVLANFPERVDPVAAGYVAVTDCRMIGQRLVLVRQGEPDVLVAVADCAWAFHASDRAEQGLIADVDVALWTGPWRPQYAELWTPAARAAYLGGLAIWRLGPALAM